jgi:DNA-binding transcriptional ArsR family regulator
MVQASNRCGPRGSASCCSGLQSLLSPKLFKALSDPKRLSLLARLAEEREPCTVGHLANGSGVDLSVVSRHLAILREADIIRCEKRGKEVWCVVQTAAIVKALRDLADAIESCCPEVWPLTGPGDATQKSTAPKKPRAR